MAVGDLAFEIQQAAAQRTGTVVAHRLVGDHDEIGGPPTDVDHRDRHAESLGLELHATVRLRDDVVVPGRERLGNDLVERDRGGLAAVDRLHRLLEARPFALDDLQALTAVLEVEAADRQARYRMHRPPGESGLVQCMLDDRTIETGERIAVEMRRLTVDLADGEQRVVGLVLEHPLLAAVQPGDVRAADARPRRDRDQAPIRQGDLGERIAVVQADADRVLSLAIGHVRLRL